MKLWLLDASVFLASEDSDDKCHRDSRLLLEGADPLATVDLVFYEIANVAVRSWRDPLTAHRLCERVNAVAEDGGLVRAETSLLASAVNIADEHGISVYDATYVAASRALGSQLVSCDVRGLVSKGLACLPGEAISS